MAHLNRSPLQGRRPPRKAFALLASGASRRSSASLAAVAGFAAVAGLAALTGLWAAACSRASEAPSAQQHPLAAAAPQPRPAAPPAASLAGEPPTNELRPQPQGMKLGDALAAPVPGHGQGGAPRAESDLTARERRLADRQAALDARERQLRRREQAQGMAAATNPGGPPASAPGKADSGGAETAGAAAAGPAAGPGDLAAGVAGALPDAAGAPAPPVEAAEPPEWQPPATPVTLATGTSFEVELTKALASNTSSVGETFRARLVADLRQDGAVAIPAGSEVLGVVTDAVAARRIGGRAKLTVKFTDLVLPTGATVPMRVSFLEEGKSKTGRDAATIGGATAGGALLGRILGNSRGGTILGALVGAAVGTGIAARTSGEEVVIPEGSVISLKLDQPLTVEVHHPER